ncbi:hypothetical protein BC567DRAFT_232092 [Phyllosticta citribraziliensis]
MRNLYVHDSVEIAPCALKIVGNKVLVLAPVVQADFIACGVTTAGRRLHQAAVPREIYDDRRHVDGVGALSAFKS